MRINKNSILGGIANVYLDGKKLDNCLEADDEKGIALVGYKDVNGEYVSEGEAEKGAMILGGIQVIEVRGKVTFEFDAAPEKVEEYKRLHRFEPLKITTK